MAFRIERLCRGQRISEGRVVNSLDEGWPYPKTQMRTGATDTPAASTHRIQDFTKWILCASMTL